MNFIKAEPTACERQEEFDNPHNSTWTLAVSDTGEVFILSMPNLHEGFTDYLSPDELGLPTDLNKPTGVYQCICSFHETKDWETGHVDDWWFEIESMTCLWGSSCST